MLRTLKTIFALALAACAAAIHADPPDRIGRVNYVAGAVSFAPAEAPDQWMQATLNRPLTSGDRLWADDNSRAELHVGSTALRLSARTSLDVLNLDDRTLQLRLAQGAINVRVRELAHDEWVEIATPGGAVVIRRPGSYRVSADAQSDVSRVGAGFGQADVITPTQTFTLVSGQAASFDARANPSFEAASYAAPDDLDRWSADRDRREDRVTSTRYVSPQTTGYEDLDDYGAWRTLPEYGAVWIPARVAPGWAPYRHGHWVWVAPWGWTWVDDAPWGFAPFHYGRWVWLDGHWAWAPGRFVARPVYAPALVVFVGGPRASFSLRSGPAVGWFPLGWRDPYLPSFRASERFVRNVNVTHVTNVNIDYTSRNIANIHYANRNNSHATTVVPQQAFLSAQPVAQSAVQVAPAQLASAELVHGRAPARPVRASFGHERPGQRPPAAAVAREVVAVSAPAKPAVQAALSPQDAAQGQTRRAGHEPRVRVIGRERGEPSAANVGLTHPVQPQTTAPAREGTLAPRFGAAAAHEPPRAAVQPLQAGAIADDKRTAAAPGPIARPPQAANADEKTPTVSAPQAAAPKAEERARAQTESHGSVARDAFERRTPPAPAPNSSAREVPATARPPQAAPSQSAPAPRAMEAAPGGRSAETRERGQTPGVVARPETRPAVEQSPARREPSAQREIHAQQPRAVEERRPQHGGDAAVRHEPPRPQRAEPSAAPRAEHAPRPVQAAPSAPPTRTEPQRPAQAEMQRARAPQPEPVRAPRVEQSAPPRAEHPVAVQPPPASVPRGEPQRPAQAEAQRARASQPESPRVQAQQPQPR